MRLRRVNFALEDALFPVSLEAFQIEWELQRAFRTHPPDEAAIMMLDADLERIEGQFESVIAEHRKMARAILSQAQLAALGRLESALELFAAAQEAVFLNLIVEPYVGPVNEDGVRPTTEAVSLSERLARLQERRQGRGTALVRVR